jgi:dihydroorotate dehydrogenase
VYAYYGDSRALAHEKVVMPAIRAVMDAEESHKLAVKVLSLPAWARPKDTRADAAELRTEVSSPKSQAIGGMS